MVYQQVFCCVFVSVVVQAVNLCFYSSPVRQVIIGMMNGMMTLKVEGHKLQRGQIMQHTLQDRYQNQAALVM